MLSISFFVCALSTGASFTAAVEPVDMRLRIAWGGGVERGWQGLIRVEEGRFSRLRTLGLSADTPGSMEIENGRQIRVQQRGPRGYDGIDVTVTAPLDSNLTIQLEPVLPPSAGRAREAFAQPKTGTVTMTLADLVSGYRNVAIDDQNNRLLIRRAPGDRLRVQLSGDALLFAPGTQMLLEVTPHLIGLEQGASLRCEIKLAAAGSDSPLWRDEDELRLDASGSAGTLGPYRISMPDNEGVYDVTVSLYRNRLKVPLMRMSPVQQRKVQLVVLDSKPPPIESRAWQYDEVDPSNPSWWEWMSRLPGVAAIPGWDQGKPLNNGKVSKEVHSDSTRLRLAPGGWQAYPLSISGLNEPHILEIEYPGDRQQTLGISVVEPNAAGGPVSLDSGVDVPEPQPAEAGQMRWHRLIFWPRTTTPMVLLANQRPDQPAVFGRIRLGSGPKRLPPALLTQLPGRQRLLTAYFDKPLFPENFSAAEAFDQARNGTLDDWATFYHGGQRLVQYLKHVGYNSAMICVARGGGAIYPSKLLQPTPKYDNGLFFFTGQDPVSKDVLEMLFQLFDREGLQLIPAVHFSSTLPELEYLRRHGGEEAKNIELTGPLGQLLQAQNPAFYNPLDPQVQQAMRRVIRELAQRYGHHLSFAGVALQLGPDTYAQLPDTLWGLDDRTIARFEAAMGIELSGSSGPKRFAERANQLSGPKRREWLTWRAQVLAELHAAMAADVRQQRPDARLYLAGADMFLARHIQRDLRPQLPGKVPIEATALKLGISPALYRDHPEIVLLRPQRLAPLTSLAAQAVNIQMATDPAVDQFFAGNAQKPSLKPLTGSLFFHEPLAARLPSFDEVNPIGPEQAVTTLLYHFAPSGDFNRARFVQSMAALDPQIMADGGWMTPLGQEEALRDLIEVYRLLPAARFQDVKPQSADQHTQPVLVRQLVQRSRTYVYVLNDSPWPVRASVQLRAAAGCRLRALGRRSLSPLAREGDQYRWNIQLQPFDLVAAWLNSPDARVVDWQVEHSDQIIAQLREGIGQLRARVHALQEPEPLPLLENAGFEAPGQTGVIPGWQHNHNQGLGISVDTDQRHSHSGKQSVRLSSRGGLASMRSKPFTPPATGQLYVLVRMRIDDPDKQPHVRVALDDGQRPFTYLDVGAGDRLPKIQDQWGNGFLFPFDELPLELNQVMIRFDLLGPGEVWIDDVELFGYWFQRHQRNELTNNIGLADYDVDNGKVASCKRFLDGYWPRFLMDHVSARSPRLAEAPQRAERSAGNPAAPRDTPHAPAAAEPPKSSTWDRVRGLVPKMPSLKFPFQTTQ